MKTPILGGYAVARSVNAADNRLMNLYPEATPEGGKTSGFLTRCPGYKFVANVGTGPIRGLWTFGGFLYVVSGVELYKVDTAWTATLLGSVSGSGPVSMSDNGEQLFIACNPRGYTYSVASNLFAEITDPDFPGAVTVGFINGYFVFNEPNSQKVWITSYQDGSSVDPLEFSYTDANPDLLLSLMINRNEIWMFGTTSTEVWYYSGDIDFPLARIQGAFNEIGCAAPYSVAKLDNTVFWLGSDPRGNAMVYKAVGYGAQRVSTHGIEKVLQGYEYVGDAIGYSYQQEGHTFYVLTFPSANATWVFDAATNEWHERGSWKQGRYNRHRSNCQANFNNTIVLGDFQYGKLYEFDLEYYQDDVGTQRWVRSWRALPPNANNLNRTAHHSLQVEMETGTETIASTTPAVQPVALTIDPGNTHPLITLSNGNLTAQSTGGFYTNYGGISNRYHTSGKRYFEFIQDICGNYNCLSIGFATNVTKVAEPDALYLGAAVGSIGVNLNAGFTGIGLVKDGVFLGFIGTAITTNNNVIGAAVDFDSGKMWFSVNGVWTLGGNPDAGTNPALTFTPHTAYYPAFSIADNVYVLSINFGETPFSYSIPSGFSSWKTNAIDAPVTLAHYYYNTLGLLSNGNLTYTWNSGSSYGCVYGTLGRSTNKYYFEIVNTQPGGLGGDTYDNWSLSGGISSVRNLSNGVIVGSISGSYGFSNRNAAKLSTKSSIWNNGSFLDISVPQIPLNGYLGVAVDLDAGKVWFNVNGTWINGGSPSTGTGATFSFTSGTLMYPAMGQGSYSPYGGSTINLGATAFIGSLPEGFLSWDEDQFIPAVTVTRIPKVLLRWSDDGGHTWSNYYDREMGALGEYWTRVIWRRLGMTTKLRDRVYELSGSDPVKITVTGAELVLSGTNS